jgi:hypothetical protein
MCDPVLIAVILHQLSFPRTVVGNPFCHAEGRSPVAIPCLSLEKLGFLNENKEKEKKDEADDGRRKKDRLKNSGDEEKQLKNIVNKRFDP